MTKGEPGKVLSRERLEQLYIGDNLPVAKIAGITGVSRETVYKHLKKHNLFNHKPVFGFCLKQNNSSFGLNQIAELLYIRKKLKKKESEICCLIYIGKMNKEIADCLCLTENAVKNLIKRIFSKLNLQTRSEIPAMIINLIFNISHTFHCPGPVDK